MSSRSKSEQPHIHCARTESILVIYGAEFRLDFGVEFAAMDVITNHRALLKIPSGDFVIMSVINRV
jgi:hypothetical protein